MEGQTAGMLWRRGVRSLRRAGTISLRPASRPPDGLLWPVLVHPAGIPPPVAGKGRDSLTAIPAPLPVS